MFVAPAGRVLVDADYSQIELRLLAHISGDEALIAAFREGRTSTPPTAAQVFGVAQDQVTPDMRRAAKAVNFGIVYGISPFSLSQDIHVTVAQAKEYMDKYFATTPACAPIWTGWWSRAGRTAMCPPCTAAAAGCPS